MHRIARSATRAGLLVATLVLATPVMAPVLAEEQTDGAGGLKPGPGRDTVAANCIGCHSLDYIRMNSTFLTPDGWKAEVAKMRQAYGAPIDQPTADAITHYLAATYATGRS